MKVLVIGGGGREHTLVWKLSQSPKVTRLYCAPGNGGISALAECVPISAVDKEGIVAFVEKTGIDLTIVAPDDPLAIGMVDALEERGHRAFGPRQNAAVIEASKVFAKELMKKYHIPSAAYESFDRLEAAQAYLDGCTYPVVVKADGLALGKGVVIAQNRGEAEAALKGMMVDRIFGKAGDRVLIEEFMTGPEVSILAFTDGHTIVPMVSSQDHKRVFDQDQGPNTGGMGTFSPSPRYTPEVAAYVEQYILIPTMEAMNREGRPFKGVLYFGLMLTPQGPKVLEYNARFGDPETQVVLPLLKSDLLEILESVINETLEETSIEWYDRAAVCVVLASGGYPGDYRKGLRITGLDTVQSHKDVMVFHAGTALQGEEIVTAGGRVIGVTATANTLQSAIDKVYQEVGYIHFDHMHYRSDIGKK